MNTNEEENITALQMAFLQVKYQSYECNCQTCSTRYDNPKIISEIIDGNK